MKHFFYIRYQPIQPASVACLRRLWLSLCGLVISGSSLLLAVYIGLFSLSLSADEQKIKDPYPVKITKNLPYLDVTLSNGKTVRIQRNQDMDAMVEFDYAYTSRPCPPYCAHPMSIGAGIETVGELEVLDYLRRISAGDNTIMIVDTRTEEWLQKGMIPGAVSVPWTRLHYGRTSQEDIIGVLEFEFGVNQQGQLLNFEHAKTLVLYCNGSWCGQSVTSINALRLLGYPTEKLKWYRDGIQGWVMLGLTLITPDSNVVKP